jgi:hypothetical protein
LNEYPCGSVSEALKNILVIRAQLEQRTVIDAMISSCVHSQLKAKHVVSKVNISLVESFHAINKLTDFFFRSSIICKEPDTNQPCLMSRPSIRSVPY